MKFNSPTWKRCRAFSLVEASFAVGVIGITVVALCGGFAGGFSTTQVSIEDSRATQILVDKMEAFRTLTWDQLNDTNLVPATFVTTYAPSGTNQGWQYTGTTSVSVPAMSSAYSNDLRLITVTVSWQAGNMPRSRSWKTMISKHGLSNYRYY